MRVNIMTVLNPIPITLDFFWHMLHHVPVKVEWQTIAYSQEMLVHNVFPKANQWFINYYDDIWQQVLKYGLNIKVKLQVKNSSLCVH